MSDGCGSRPGKLDRLVDFMWPFTITIGDSSDRACRRDVYYRLWSVVLPVVSTMGRLFIDGLL